MKSILKFGLWTGLTSGFWSIISFSLVSALNNFSLHHSIPASQIRSYSGLFSLLILILGIYFGMKELKSKNGGVLSFGQAAKTGIGIACVVGVILAVFSYLYCTTINPGYADFMIKDTENTLRQAGMKSEEIKLRLEKVRKEFSTSSQVTMALVGQSVLGSIASLVIALFIRTKKTN